MVGIYQQARAISGDVGRSNRPRGDSEVGYGPLRSSGVNNVFAPAGRPRA